jgi:hypothetical protein
MNILGKILSVPLAFVFLISASGFSFTRHICYESDAVKVIQGKDYVCSVENATTGFEEENSCCQLTDSESHTKNDALADCCIEDTRFFQTDTDFTNSFRPIVPKNEISVTFVHGSIDFLCNSRRISEFRAYAPPDLFDSRDHLIQYGFLLI